MRVYASDEILHRYSEEELKNWNIFIFLNAPIDVYKEIEDDLYIEIEDENAYLTTGRLELAKNFIMEI